MRPWLLLLASIMGAAAVLGVGIAGAVGGDPGAAPATVPASRADLPANPDGPATRVVATASRQLTACFLRNGARRVQNTGESGFRVEGLSGPVRASCVREDAALTAAYADPRYKLEQEALTLVMNHAWRCVAALGYSVTGFSVLDGADSHTSAQAGIDSALAACRSEAALALNVSLPE